MSKKLPHMEWWRLTSFIYQNIDIDKDHLIARCQAIGFTKGVSKLAYKYCKRRI